MGFWIIGTKHLKNKHHSEEKETKMPKLNLGIKTSDVGAAEGYEAWPEDKLPETGSYSGKLKVCQLGKTSATAKNPNKLMLKVGVELVDAGPATGFVAFRNLVLIDSVAPYVNQFLRALTNGSDAEFDKIRKAFDSGPVVDERQINILKIGQWKINSPEGELPIKVSIKRGSYTPTGSTTPVATANINSFLLNANPSASGGGVVEDDDEPVAEEADDDVDLTEEADESVFDTEDESETVSS